VATVQRDVEELATAREPDPMLTLMVRRQETTTNVARDVPSSGEGLVKPEVEIAREELFQLNIQIKRDLVAAIIDPGSQKNLIAEEVVQRMRLETRPHPYPYVLGWIKKGVELRVERQCTFKFAITSKYVDEVTCEVVPLDMSHVVFGSPYIYDRDAILYRREHKYRLVKDGKEFIVRALKPPSVELATAGQVKRVVSTRAPAFVMLLPEVINHADASHVIFGAHHPQGQFDALSPG
jgi:hypothetical protein